MLRSRTPLHKLLDRISAPRPAARRLLALAIYPDIAAATRFRVSAYTEALAAAGIELDLEPFVSASTMNAIHSAGPHHMVALALARATLDRLRLLTRQRQYTAVLVQREAVLVGPPWFEWLLRELGLPLIYDVDDAVWLNPAPIPGSFRARFPRIMNIARAAGKGNHLLSMATEVICGSDKLADYARTRAASVTTIPTVTDLRDWKPAPRMAVQDELTTEVPPILGWIGTPSTAPNLAYAEPALLRLRAEGVAFSVRVRGAGKVQAFKTLAYENLPWRKDFEVADFQEIDIGLAPMENTAWSAGKCAFKQIQYMAVGVPHVTSRAGAVDELVVHDQNALIAESDDGWYHSLSRLLRERELRQRLSVNGLDTVRERYSLQAQAPRFVDVVERAMRAAAPTG
jgi:glycosyltransferase involved in cell wall biosynthesis